MPRLTKEQYITMMKAKLRRNVDFIKKNVTGFDMDDAQIDKYVRDRIDAHLIAKASPKYGKNYADTANDKIYSYLPGKYMPKAFSRIQANLVQMNGTPESEKYNRMLLSGLTRDDEKGKAKFANLSYVVFNLPYEIDLDIAKKPVYDKEFAKYAVNHAGLGNSCHTYSSALYGDQIKIKNTDKFNAVKAFGENIGSIMQKYSESFGNEMMLTVPLEMLNADQFAQLTEASSHIITAEPKNDEIKNAITVANYVLANQDISSQSRLGSQIETIERDYPEPFKFDDFALTENARFEGGYSKRIEQLRAFEQRIDKIDTDESNYVNLIGAYREFLSRLDSINGLPGENEITELSGIAARFNKVAGDFNGSFFKNRSKFADMDAAHELVTDMIAAMRPFINAEQFKSLVSYERSPEDVEVPSPEEIVQARRDALKTDAQPDYENILSSDIEVDENELDGFVYITEQDVPKMERGYIEGGIYVPSERFESAYAALSALTGSDSDEMKLVKDEFGNVRALIKNHATPEQVKAGLEILQGVARRYTFNPRKRHNNRWAAVNEVLSSCNEELDNMDGIIAANEINRAVSSILSVLDKAFGEAEKATKGFINRYDSVMIGGKTLRGLLTEEIAARHGGSIYDWSKEEIAAVDNPNPEHAAKIILAALSAGKKVEYFKLDPENNYAISAHPVNGKPEMTIEKPSILSTFDQNALERFKTALNADVKLDFSKKVSTAEQHERIDTCRRGVIRNNWLKRSKLYCTSFDRDFMVKAWQEAHKNDADYDPDAWKNFSPQYNKSTSSIERDTIPGAVFAYLINEKNMKIDDLCDPGAFVKEKAEAAAYIIDQFRSDDPAALQKLSETALSASMKIVETINGIMSYADMNDDADLFNDNTAYVEILASSLQSISQNFQTNDNSAVGKAWRNSLASGFGLEPGSPDVDKYYAATAKRFISVPTLKSILLDGKQAFANIATGCRYNTNDITPGISGEILRSKYISVSNELSRTENANEQDASEKHAVPFLTSLGASTAIMNIKNYSLNIVVSANIREQQSDINRDFAKLYTPTVKGSSVALASEYFSGKLRNDYYMESDKDGNAYFISKDRIKNFKASEQQNLKEIKEENDAPEIMRRTQDTKFLI